MTETQNIDMASIIKQLAKVAGDTSTRDILSMLADAKNELAEEQANEQAAFLARKEIIKRKNALTVSSIYQAFQDIGVDLNAVTFDTDTSETTTVRRSSFIINEGMFEKALGIRGIRIGVKNNKDPFYPGLVYLEICLPSWQTKDNALVRLKNKVENRLTMIGRHDVCAFDKDFIKRLVENEGRFNRDYGIAQHLKQGGLSFFYDDYTRSSNKGYRTLYLYDIEALRDFLAKRHALIERMIGAYSKHVVAEAEKLDEVQKSIMQRLHQIHNEINETYKEFESRFERTEPYILQILEEIQHDENTSDQGSDFRPELIGND